MAKTKEELEQLKNEYVSLKEKLLELSEDELSQIAGGQGVSEFENTRTKCKGAINEIIRAIRNHIQFNRPEHEQALKKAMSELEATIRDIDNINTMAQFPICQTHWDCFKSYIRAAHAEQFFESTDFKYVEELINVD